MLAPPEGGKTSRIPRIPRGYPHCGEMCFRVIPLPRSSSEVASKVGENCPTVAVVVSTPYLVGERRTQAITAVNSG